MRPKPGDLVRFEYSAIDNDFDIDVILIGLVVGLNEYVDDLKQIYYENCIVLTTIEGTQKIAIIDTYDLEVISSY